MTVKREKRKKIITSLSCARVRLPPEVNDTMAGAKWANHLVAPQDNELISNQTINWSIQCNQYMTRIQRLIVVEKDNYGYIIIYCTYIFSNLQWTSCVSIGSTCIKMYIYNRKMSTHFKMHFQAMDIGLFGYGHWLQHIFSWQGEVVWGHGKERTRHNDHIWDFMNPIIK